jgi:hypothetical protein
VRESGYVRTNYGEGNRPELGGCISVPSWRYGLPPTPSREVHRERRDVRQWLGQVYDAALRAPTRLHASFVRRVVLCHRLVNRGLLRLQRCTASRMNQAFSIRGGVSNPARRQAPSVPLCVTRSQWVGGIDERTYNSRGSHLFDERGSW